MRRLDHVNYLGVDVEANRRFLRDRSAPGHRTDQLDDGAYRGQLDDFTQQGLRRRLHRDRTGTPGPAAPHRLRTDTREDILRAADLALDHGVFIETGPHKHAIQQTFFLYVYEPGGNRIELCNPVRPALLAPDWQTVTGPRPTAPRARPGG